jgi:hypothetical protein
VPWRRELGGILTGRCGDWEGGDDWSGWGGERVGDRGWHACSRIVLRVEVPCLRCVIGAVRKGDGEMGSCDDQTGHGCMIRAGRGAGWKIGRCGWAQRGRFQ